MRATADGTGRQIEAQLAKSVSLKDDLSFLTERGDRLADRLDTLVRAARPLAPERSAPERAAPERAAPQRPASGSESSGAKATNQVESDLMQALRMAR